MQTLTRLTTIQGVKPIAGEDGGKPRAAGLTVFVGEHCAAGRRIDLHRRKLLSEISYCMRKVLPEPSILKRRTIQRSLHIVHLDPVIPQEYNEDQWRSG